MRIAGSADGYARIFFPEKAVRINL